MWDWFVKRGWASRELRLVQQTREINPPYRTSFIYVYYYAIDAAFKKLLGIQ